MYFSSSGMSASGLAGSGEASTNSAFLARVDHPEYPLLLWLVYCFVYYQLDDVDMNSLIDMFVFFIQCYLLVRWS